MSSAPPPLPPVERMVALLQWVVQAVAARMRGGALPVPLINLITDRLGRIRQRFSRLAARIAAGTYTPRRPYTRTPPENPKPRSPSALPTGFGWLLTLVPAVPDHRQSAGAARYALQELLDDPEMQALIAVAPDAMGRILRPFCWMLGLKPPPILAWPGRRGVPRKVASPPAADAPPQSPARPLAPDRAVRVGPIDTPETA